MKKIYLMISTYFPICERPWDCVFVYDQVRAILAESSYQVIVIKPNQDTTYEFHGVKVIGFKMLMTGAWLCPRIFGWINTRRMFVAMRRAGISPKDVAVAHGQLVPMGVYLNALKAVNPKIRTILQFQDPDPYGMLFGTGRFGGLKKIIYFLYYRGIVEKIDTLVAISRNVAKVLAEAPRQTVYNTYEPMRYAMHVLRHFRCARIKPAYVLHNGVNQEIFSPPETLSISTTTDHTLPTSFTIGCVAVFRDWKDQISLVKATERLKDKIPGLKVLLRGMDHSGTMFRDCQRYIIDHELPVELKPPVDHESLPAFYRSLDLFVLPSYFEGFGCVFTEAWSCGTPFITCEGQAMDDLVYPEDRNKWLCKQQNPVDLADKIYAFYQNRWKQRLNGSVNINEMVRKFMNDQRL